NEDVNEENPKYLTINQTLMTVDAWTNIPLDSAHVNQTGLAELLSRMTHMNSESIRRRLAQGISYEGPRAKKDADYVASLLEKVDAELAQRVRNNVAGG
ncbi:hypothetical protein EVA_21981, partial [gut metagenome]